MPRSGGEYIYQSRILHPALGFTSNAIIWYGSSGMLVANFALVFVQWLSGHLSVISFFAHIPSLTDFATYVMTPAPLFLVGTFVMLACAVIAILGTRYLIAVQTGAMLTSVVAMIVSWGLLLTYTNQDFVNTFNAWMAPYAGGATDPYHYIIQTAQNSGFQVPPIAISATIMALGIHFLWASYFQWTSYSSGEFKGASSIKRQAISMLGAQIFVGLMCALIAYTLVSVVGREFLASTFYLFNFHADQLPLPVQPSIATFMTLATHGSVPVSIIITVAFLATMVQLILICFLMTSRCVFAWSFDRIAPSWLADVHARFGTPWKAIALVLILAVGYLAAYTWLPPWFYMYIWTASYFSQIIITFLFTGVAAVYYSISKKWKSSYDASPAKRYEIAGIPLMAVFGLISILTMLLFAGIYLSDPSYGVTWDFGIPYNIAMIIVPIVIFYAVRAYRKGQGINIDLAFKEVPPE